MSGKSDQAKGRVKEAAGVISGNQDLESEGKTDRLAGEVKEQVEHGKDKVEGLIDRAKHKLHRK